MVKIVRCFIVVGKLHVKDSKVLYGSRKLHGKDSRVLYSSR